MKNKSCDTAYDKCAEWMNDVGTGTNGDEARKRADMDEAGIVFGEDKRGKDSSHHGEKGIHCYKPADSGKTLALIR